MNDPLVAAPRYPTIRSGGLFVALMGLTVLVASGLGPAGSPQIGVFFGGMALSALAAFMVFRRRLQRGAPTPAQRRASRIALALEVVLLSGVWFWLGAGEPRTLWLAILLVVGGHFLGFRPVHGPLMTWLGLLCLANAAAGLWLAEMPLLLFSAIDGGLKLAFGLAMLAARDDGGRRASRRNLTGVSR